MKRWKEWTMKDGSMPGDRKPHAWMRVLLALFLSVALVACGAGAEPTDTTGDRSPTVTEEGSVPNTAEGQAWEPDRPVTIVVPAGPGGGTDTFGRALAQGLQEVRPDVNIAVENRPGAGTAIAYTYILGREGDPHQLIITEPSVVSLPPTAEEANYHWSDFSHMGIGGQNTPVVITAPGRYGSLLEVVELAREENVSVGLAGLSGALAFSTTLLAQEMDVEFDRVVLDSAGEIVTNVIAENVDFGVVPTALAIENVEAGTVDAIAVFSEEAIEESPALADVPTARDQDIPVAFTGFWGLAGPPNLQEPEIQYWTDAFADWTQSDHYEAFIADNLVRMSAPAIGDEVSDFLTEYEELVLRALEAEGGE